MYLPKAFLHILPVILTLAQVHRSEGLIDGNQASLDDCTINSPCYPDIQPPGAAACYDDRYLGCFHTNGERVLPGNQLISNYMTIEKCIQYCKNNTENIYAGVENSNECYCGDVNADYDHFGRLGDGGCQFLCAGDIYSSCGGHNGIDVFNLSVSLPSETTVTESQMISVTTSSDATRTTPQNGMLTRNTKTAQPPNNCSCLCEIQQSANTEVAIAFGVLFGVTVIYSIFVSVGFYLTRRALLALKESQNSKEQDDQYQAIDRGAMEKPALYQDLKPTEEKKLSGKDHTYESHLVVDESRDLDNAYELNNF